MTTRDEAVPEVCVELAALESAAVRNRFALDILATYTDWLHEQNRKVERLTPCLRLAQVGADLPCAYADHAETLCLVKCPNLFLRLAERHAISKLTELGLRVSFLGFARTGVLESSVTSKAEQEELHAPSATTSLLRAIVGYGKRFDHLRWWRRGQPVEMLLDLFSELLSISACDTGEKTSSRGGDKVGNATTDHLFCFVLGPFGRPTRTWRPQYAAA